EVVRDHAAREAELRFERREGERLEPFARHDLARGGDDLPAPEIPDGRDRSGGGALAGHAVASSAASSSTTAWLHARGSSACTHTTGGAFFSNSSSYLQRRMSLAANS